VQADYGAKLTVPAPLTETGYVFGGWYTDEAATDGNEWDFTANTMPAKDIILYAKWTIGTFTVTFDANGHGTAPAPVRAVFATAIEEPESLTAEGYTFEGWHTDKETSDDNAWNFATDTMPAKDITLYASWTKNPPKPEEKPDGDNDSNTTPGGSDDTPDDTGGNPDGTAENPDSDTAEDPEQPAPDNPEQPTGTWSLLNLLLTILTVAGLALAAWTAIRTWARSRKQTAATGMRTTAKDARSNATATGRSTATARSSTAAAWTSGNSDGATAAAKPLARVIMTVAAAIIAAASVAMLFITQDFTGRMILIDRYTLLFAALFLAQGILVATNSLRREHRG
jgi:internalin A